MAMPLIVRSSRSGEDPERASHAIWAREFGLPAVIGAGSAYDTWRQGRLSAFLPQVVTPSPPLLTQFAIMFLTIRPSR